MKNFVHQKLGRYLIIDEIAKGGMAQIYRAQLLGIAGFAKDVAIKKILPFWSQNDDFINMLIDEAKILVQLQHPNIVQVFELGKEHNSFFIVMEYVQGLDLRSFTKILQDKNLKLPQPLIAYIIKQICLGLDFAHQKTDLNHEPLNIVHRDISPQNILIGCEGEIKITDFGIAKTTQKTAHTQTGVLKGKFSYMSPEQALGEDIDQQTDVFALGLLLFELLHGRKCFDGKNDFEIIDKVKNAAIAIDESFDEILKGILSKALALDKSKRYPSALEMYHDLEVWEAHLSKKCLARDLKLFLKEHAPNIWQTKAAPLQLQSSEDKTAIHAQEEPSPSYTIITQATTLWEKTKVQNTAQTKLHQWLEKTRIFKPAPTEQTSTQIEVRTRKDSQLNFSRLSFVGMALLVVWTGIYFVSQKKSSADEAQALTPTEEPLSTATSNESALQTNLPPVPTQNEVTIPTPPPVAAPLPKPMGHVSVKTVPQNAVLQIQSAMGLQNAVGQYDQELDLSGEPQKVLITASLEKYKTQTLTLTLTRDTPNLSQTITLAPLEIGKLSVDSRPWANFTIEGYSNKSFSTPNSLQLPEGSYTLRVFSPSQNKSITKTVVIKPNGQTFCRATFANKNSVACSYSP